MSYTNQEANWGPVIPTEVAKGSHLTFELPLRHKDSLVALRLKEGIHGAANTNLFFPHGLIRFGESVPDCVHRIVQEIAGVNPTSFKPVALEAWLDNDQHYHICATMLAQIEVLPSLGNNIEEIVIFKPEQNIDRPFAWWSAQDIASLFHNHWSVQ